MEQENQYESWYRANSPALPEPVRPTAKPKKKRTGMKATMLVICVLLLIVATAVAFSEPEQSLRQPSVTPSRSPDAGDSFGIPGWNWGNDSDPEDFADDFRDFFNGYYTDTEDSSKPSGVRRGETGSGVTLDVRSSRGLEELSFQELYSESIDSIVGIKARTSGSLSYSWGTGIVMDAEGYILTNQHVIGGADRAYVVLSDGAELEALLIGEDTQTDIAVLHVKADKALIPAAFGDSGELSVGDEVVAIGNPLGEDLSGTMTNGIISAINRDINSNGHTMTLLQTNAAINEGNSGGPLINKYGQVVGITNMKMVNYYSDVTIEGIGFAIPSATVKTVADQLIANGQVMGRPGIGVTVGTIPDEAREHYDLPFGLYVSAVSPGSDAERQGIRPGDIITHVDGQSVLVSQDVLDIRDAHQVGDKLTFTVFRDGESFDVEVELYDVNNIY